MNLKQLFFRYNCDKGHKHTYHTVYDPEFTPLRNEPINILEIGIWTGVSHKAWFDYFPNAQIYGIDIFTRISPYEIDLLREDRVHWLKGNTTADNISQLIDKKWPGVKFDIIIDDGEHSPRANGLSFKNLSPYMKDTGTYYVEDVWPLHIMTKTDFETDNIKDREWLRDNAEIYNKSEMDFFLSCVENYHTEEFDLRHLNKYGNSYIYKMMKR
jgi:hypothetical protein